MNVKGISAVIIQSHEFENETRIPFVLRFLNLFPILNIVFQLKEALQRP
jgi:hypothetical protein